MDGYVINKCGLEKIVRAGLDSKGYRAFPPVGFAGFNILKTGQNNMLVALAADGNWFEIPTQHNNKRP